MDYKKLWETLHKYLQRSNKIKWEKRDIVDKMKDMEIQEARLMVNNPPISHEKIADDGAGK